LKGNLLVILRTDDRNSTDLLGVILLEHCSVSLVSEADVQHAFKIGISSTLSNFPSPEFKSGDASILMAARSSAEAKMWCRHISAAGLSELVALQAHLREELHKRTGTDPLDPLHKPVSHTVTVFGLLFDSQSTSQFASSSLRITVSIQEPGKSNWRILAETETETKDSPAFHRAVKSQVVAMATLSAGELRNASTLHLRMREMPSSTVLFDSPTLASSKEATRTFCTLVIQVKKFQPQSDCSQSDPHSARLRSVCENLLSQNYVFYHTLGENMRVVELMGESKLCFQFPIEYVSALASISSANPASDSTTIISATTRTTEGTSSNYSPPNTTTTAAAAATTTTSTLTCPHCDGSFTSRIGLSNPHLECLRRERLLGMKGVIERYELCLRAMVDRAGPNFKRSTERKNSELDFVPTNLHVNRIGLLDSENGLVSFHDIISVGAFSTASTRYKYRGLFQTAFSNASGNVGQPFPPSRLSLEDFADCLPSTAAILQLESHPVGVAIKRLADGAALVVQLHSDLGELKTRLQAVGQAVPLTERLDEDMSTLNALLSSYSDVFVSELAAVHENHEVLLQRIVLLATFEKMQTASLNSPTSPFNPVTQKPFDFCELEGLERGPLLQQISDSAALLDTSLTRAWERVEESLWTTVLTSITNSAACSSGGTDGGSEAVSSVLAEAATETPASTPSSTNLAAASNLWDNVNYRHHAVVCQVPLPLCMNFSLLRPRMYVDGDRRGAGVCSGLQGLLQQHSGCEALADETTFFSSSPYLSLISHSKRPCCILIHLKVLAASLTGLAVAVTRWLTVQWQQMIECGIPLCFEGLLSCYGQESEMLENWAWAIQFLVYWRVIVRPDGRTADSTVDKEKFGVEADTTAVATLSPSPLVRITGYKQCVLTIPQSAWKHVPPEYQTRGSVVLSLHPYAFNVGINEQQTVAEKLEKTGLQTAINAQGLTSLQGYFDKYTKKFGAPGTTSTNEDVCDLIVSLKHLLASNRSKPVEILELAARISLPLNAIRLTSCKSAKDRTGMAVSLEQARWLQNVEWMKPDTFSSALKCIRSTGLRLSNTEKNVGVRKYAFTRLQLLSFPRLYRPPVGTYSLYAAT
uniref:PH domain-containing protein n=2 Tax=Schistocephalus solidus TaxID=70667 RepID=A0A183SIF2_SCHSO